MKKIFLSTAAASLCLLTACQQSGGNGASMPSNASAADSLIFYLGEVYAAQYKNEAKADTTLDTPEAKRAYLEGVKAGINLPKDNDDAYNKGLQVGMQMATSVAQFNKEYNVTLNKTVYLSSLTGFVMSDSAVNQRDAQKEFGRLMQQFQEEKENRDREAAIETLSQAVAGKGYDKITDDLYYKITAKNDSAEIKNGDMVNPQIEVKKLDGESVYFTLPARGRVGAPNFKPVINDALMKLRSGETGEFMTTAHALFGARAQQMGMEPSEVLVYTLCASIAPEKDKAKDSDGIKLTEKPKVKMN